MRDGMRGESSSWNLRQWTAVFAGGLLLLAVLAAGWLLAQRPAWQAYQRAYLDQAAQAEPGNQPGALAVRALTPTLTGKPELCTTCHLGIEEISPSHPVAVFGCVTCHGGDGGALDQQRAHRGLRGGRNPSDLSVVQVSCGAAGCHGGQLDPEQNHVDRVLRSLQATYAGGIGLVRYSFGAQDERAAQYGAIAAHDPQPAPGGIADLAPMPVTAAGDLTAALAAQGVTASNHPIDTTFRQSCLSGGCHLSAPPTAVAYRYRSTGCAACHYPYADDGRYKGGDVTIATDEPGHGRIHQLTTAIPFTQCNHCHNRGNYSLRTMAFTPRPDLPPAGAALSQFTPPKERRLAEYYQPIGQFTLCEWALDCVDCHTGEAAMGDGHIAGAMADAQATECRTCHGTLTAPPQTAPITDANEAAMRQARLNGHGDLQVGDRVVVNRKGEKLWSVKQAAPGHFVATLKVSGARLDVPLVQGSACQQQPDQQASKDCHQCHAYDRGAAPNGAATP